MKRKRTRKDIMFLVFAVFVLSVILGDFVAGQVLANADGIYRNFEILTNAFTIIREDYVEEKSSQELIRGALRGMMRSLDPHSQFMEPALYNELEVETEGEFGGLGIQITLDRNGIVTVISPIEGTPAYEQGVKAGDRIIKIDGKSTRGLTLMEAVKKLRGPKGTDVTITVFRATDGAVGKEIDFTITRAIINIPSVRSEVLEDDIGYVRIKEFQKNTADDLRDLLLELKKEGIKSLIIDLRHNPGGLLPSAVNVTDKFLPRGQLIVSTKARDEKKNMQFYAREEPMLRDHPIVVLVDQGSASASEIVAGALKDTGRAVILGTKTFGKGSVQSIVPLPDGSALRLTTAQYFTPKGISIDGIGIEPHITVAIPTEVQRELAKRVRDAEIPPLEEDKPERDEKEKQQAAKIKDVQLQRAIQLLQGHTVFEGLRTKQAAKPEKAEKEPPETGALEQDIPEKDEPDIEQESEEPDEEGHPQTPGVEEIEGEEDLEL